MFGLNNTKTNVHPVIVAVCDIAAVMELVQCWPLAMNPDTHISYKIKELPGKNFHEIGVVEGESCLLP